MSIRHLRTLGEVAHLLQRSQALKPIDVTQPERYQWIERSLHHFQYARLGKPDEGLLIAYLCAIAGYSDNRSRGWSVAIETRGDYAGKCARRSA